MSIHFEFMGCSSIRKDTNFLRNETGGGYGAVIGTVVGTVAGIALAPYTGGASLYVIAALGLIGGIAGGFIDAATRPTPDPMIQDGIKDLSVTSAALGTMIPIIFGKYRIAGNIIHATSKMEHEHELEGSGGGGGKGGYGGNSPLTIIKTYTVTLAVALCEGPIEKITRVWADFNLLYDESQPLNKIQLLSSTVDLKIMETPDHAQIFKLFPGSEEQEPSTDLEALHGEGNVPAYRGTAYVVMLNLDLGSTGRIPNFTFEVQQSTKDDTLPIDILITPSSVLILSTNSIFPVGVSEITIFKECGITFTEDPIYDDRDFSEITLLSSTTSFIDDGFVVGGTLTISGEDSDNNGVTVTITDVTGTVLTTDTELTPESNKMLTLHQQPIPALTTQGRVVSYNLESVIPVSHGKTGLNPIAFAFQPGGVVVANLGDGHDDSTDTLSLFVGSELLFTSSIPLRTPGEIAADTRIGINFIVPAIYEDTFFIGLSRVPAIAQYILGSSTYSSRYDLLSMPLGCASTETEFEVISIYVLCADSNVYKLPSTNGNFGVLIEAIPVGAGASNILAATDDKIWVSHSATNTVSHFTSVADYATVTVGTGPGPMIEASDFYIWVAVGNSVVRIDSTLYTIETFPMPVPITSFASALLGAVWAVSEVGDTVYLIDSGGTYLSVRTPPGPVEVVSDATGNAYVLCEAGRTFVFIAFDASISVSEASPNGLACVVRRVNERCGLLSGEIDVSGLDNSPVNMVLSQIQSGLATLQQLVAIYSFIGVESDGFIRYQFKTGASVASIPENALSGGVDKQDEKSLVTVRIQERELPTKVSVSYPDPLRNYGTAAQTIQLISSRVGESPFAINTPLALSAERAKQSAEVILYEAWTGRESHAFSMTTALFLLDPGDVVTVSARNIIHIIRLKEITDGQNWLRQAVAISHVSTVFSDFHVTAPNAGLGNTHLPEVARASLLLVDAPPFSSTDVTIRYLLAGYTTQTGRSFLSGSLFRSPDAVTYAHESSTHTHATVGVVVSALSSASQYVWDDTNTIIVRLYDIEDVLTPSTDTGVLNGANRFMLGNEVGAFVNATLLAPGVYALTRLLRGRFGTESYIGSHATNENFVLLTALLRTSSAVVYSESRIGVSDNFKIIDPSISIADAVSFTRTLNGNSIKPWAPVLQTPTRNVPSVNDITFGWYHRSRLNESLWSSGNDVVYDFDDTHAYKVTIYSDGTYAVIKRIILTGTFSVASGLRTQVYSSSDQISDFGSNQSTIYYGILSIANINGYEFRSSG